MLRHSGRWRLFFLALALVGYWAPWLRHPAMALNLNGYELSEWITFLPEARGGLLPVNRLSFFIPLACLAWLLSWAASQSRGPRPAHLPTWWSGLWPRTSLSVALLGLACFCAWMVFPPYEAYTRPDYWPEYQIQFGVALLTVAGMLLAWILPAELNELLHTGVAALGGGYGVWVYLVIRPYAIQLLGLPWANPGPGWILMGIGFAGLILTGLRRLLGPREEALW